jgi:hypothetical protein
MIWRADAIAANENVFVAVMLKCTCLLERWGRCDRVQAGEFPAVVGEASRGGDGSLRGLDPAEAKAFPANMRAVGRERRLPM